MKTYSSQSIQKILVPIDGSDYSIRAEEYALSIAQTHQAEIVLVYVVDDLVVERLSAMATREAVAQELKNNGHRHIKYALDLSEKAGVAARSMIAEGRPFEQIIEFAKSLDVDIIVMGTYGRRGAERILLGSVAERVIEYSQCPVLVIK
ncbi:universal stress protein [Candidatus Bathycorpusculum sp.]|uniref:universal stress protein n=1 Tax=Candidatus Bathycorpusculum sp. TaxID=2994959 RepID=UPI00281B297F|nr:universal stress protein [Candidatus Termitimicrobium sp.]MCL2685253.1 universal stress protein [Candidatus Termitimicrobium sp.]